MFEKDRIASLLSSLGNSANEIRDNLLKAGCIGERQECFSCPIANFLKQHGINAYVWDNYLYINVFIVVCISRDDGSVENCCFPRFIFPWVRDILSFMRSFDSGSFPELERGTLSNLVVVSHITP
jgi:hypothetical protein